MPVKVDLVNPTSSASISPAVHNGWYGQPTVTLTGVDAASGIDHISYKIDGEITWHTYTTPLTGFSTGNHFVQFQATDVSGRVESTVNLVAFKADAVKPSVNITHPSAGEVFPLDKVVKAAFKCTDNESGIDTCVGTVANGANHRHLDGRRPHVHGDRDGQGRERDQVTNHYKVVYTFNGFFSPIANSADSSLNLVHAGDLIKVGFGLNGDRGLERLAPFTTTPVTCPAWTPHTVPAARPGHHRGLSFGVASGHYTYGLQTRPAGPALPPVRLHPERRHRSTQRRLHVLRVDVAGASRTRGTAGGPAGPFVVSGATV